MRNLKFRKVKYLARGHTVKTVEPGNQRGSKTPERPLLKRGVCLTFIGLL